MKENPKEFEDLIREAETTLEEYSTYIKEVEQKLAPDEKFANMAVEALENSIKDWLLKTEPYMPDKEEPGLIMAYMYTTWKVMGDKLRSKGWIK